MTTLDGKTAIVTGGAEGIGFGIATALSQKGMNIVLTDINPEQLKMGEQKLVGSGAAVLALEHDVADAGQWQSVVAAATERFGKIHMLINNAGVGGSAAAIEECGSDEWDWVVGVNLMGVVHGVNAVVPNIKQHGEGGWIVNVASMAGFGPLPMAAPYSATKAAVVAISECWQAELAPDAIQVAVLCPGFVSTRINQSDRNRPARFGDKVSGTSTAAAAGANGLLQQVIDNGLPPAIVGERVVEAIEAGEFYIITHADYAPMVKSRFRGIEGAFERARDSAVMSTVDVPPMPDFG